MQILSSFGVPIALISMALAFIGVIVFVSRNYLRCPPNEVLVLYGRKHTVKDIAGQTVTRGYRLITGGSAFRLPLLEEARQLSLAVFQIPVQVMNTPNKNGVIVTVDSVANVKLSSEQAQLGAAVEQFLGKDMREIHSIIHATLEGIVRQLVGTLTIEDLICDREAIQHKVLELTQGELAKLGVACLNFVITKVVDDKDYINSLGRKRAAEVKRDAEIGEANAQREAMVQSSEAKRQGEKARLDNEAQIADATRELDVKKAKYSAEVQAEQAKAALAGEIAKADQQKDLTLKQVAVQETEVVAKTAVADKRAALVEKELVTTQIRPAEAARQAAVITAEGQKQAQLIGAEAAKQSQIITAEAARQAAVIQAEGEATAAESTAKAAEQQAAATVARADAEKHRLTAEGEGTAAAQAALMEKKGTAEAEVTKLRLTAEAEGTKAKLLAAADGTKAQGEADGTAIRAKLLAEAEGVDAKQKALAQMSEGARYILVLDRLPEIIEQSGEALAKALTPAFQAVGAGLAAVDKIEIVDFGGGNGANGGGSAAERFALAVPQIVFKAITEGRSLGVDFEGALARLGIRMTKDGRFSAVVPSEGKARDDGDKAGA